MAYYLKQITHSNQPIIIHLTEAEVIVGSNNMQLQRYPQISEQHAKFYKIENRIYIRDLSSRYGTYVNDIRIGSDIEPLTHVDIIGFGVNAKSGENGFVCKLICEPFEVSHNTRNQLVIPIKKEPPEVIDISQDDDDDDTHVMSKILNDSVKTVNPTCLDFKTSDVQKKASALDNRNEEILMEEHLQHAKNDDVVPSTSREHTSVKRKYPPTVKCSVSLIRCNSFLSPPDVKNPFFLQSEDEDILSICKKRPKRVSFHSSGESSEEESPALYLNNNVNVSKSSSREHPNDWKNILNRRKKRARKISSDSSDESSVESNNTIYSKSKKSFLNQSKTENIPSSGSMALPELSSSDISVEKTDKNVTLNKNVLNSFKIPKLSTSGESSEEESPVSYLNNNVNVSKSSSRKHRNDWKNILNCRKKRARKISSDSSDESSVKSNNTIYSKSKKSFLNQSKTENIPSSGSMVLPELPSSDFSVKKTDKNVTLNKNVLNSFKIPKLSTSNSSKESLNRNFRLNSLNKSNMETDESSSHKSYELSIQKTEVGKKLSLTRMMEYDLKKSLETMESHPEEGSYREQFHEIDPGSVAQEIINASDGVFDTDMVLNSASIKTELEDAENPKKSSLNQSKTQNIPSSDFLAHMIQNSILIKTELGDAENLEKSFLNQSKTENMTSSDFVDHTVQNSIPIKTKLEDAENPEESFLNQSKAENIPSSDLAAHVVQNSIPIKTEIEDAENSEKLSLNQSETENILSSDFVAHVVQNSIPIKTELEDAENPEKSFLNQPKTENIHLRDFVTHMVQNSIPIKTELEDAENHEESFLNQSKIENIPSSDFVAHLVQNSIPIKTELEVSENSEKLSLNQSKTENIPSSDFVAHVVQNSIPIKTKLENAENPEKSFLNQSKAENIPSSDLLAHMVQNSIPIKTELEDAENPEKSFLNQLKIENIPSIGFVALPELSSDSSEEKTDENVSLKKNNLLNSFKIPKLSTSNFTKESLNRYFHLNSLNKSNMETDECSSHKSYQLNIRKTEVGKKLFPTRMMEYDQKKNSYHEQFNEIDSGSVAEEIINVSDGGFNTDMVQNSIPLETELEDVENPESDNIIKEIFDGDVESEVLPSSVLSKNSAFDNQETESIERIQQYVNCSAQKNPVESECEGNKELNSKLTDSESEMPSEDDFLPSIKSLFRNRICGDKKNSKSSGKILLTDPKPMTFRPRKMRGRDEEYVERQKPLDLYLKRKRGRPRKEEQSQSETKNSNSSATITKIPNKPEEPHKMRGRDEEYVEWQKPLYPKRKRGRPRKEEQSQSETKNLNSSATITKIPNKPEERSNSLNNFMSKTSCKDKDMPGTGLSGANYKRSAIKPLPNSKLPQCCPSQDKKEENGDYSVKQKSSGPFAKRKEGTSKKCHEVEHEVSNRYTEKQLSEIPEKCKEKISVNDILKNKGLPSSTDTKESRKNNKSSVKIRPDKFSSPMGFLTNGEEAKPVRRDKISENSNKYKGASNAEKNYAPQTQFANKIRTDEKNVVPLNFLPISRIEDKYPESKRSSISHTLHDENSEGSILQKISHSLTNASDIDILHVKNLKDNTFQDIPISSADAPSTRTWQVKNLGNSNFQNIPPSSTDASHGISMHTENIQLPFELSFNGMVKSLLKLETVWLQEQQRNISQPPPEVMQGFETLPLCFRSYESYAASFYPLLKLKIWQDMVEKSSKEVLPNEKMRFRVLSSVNKPDCIELKCESVLNDKCCFEPREGMMTVLEMYLDPNTVYPLFGFIFKHKVNTLNENLLHPCWKKIPAEYLKDAKRWIFHVWIKQIELLLEPGILMKGSGICYLRNNLRLVDALQRFKDSPLMTDIIEPRLQTFALSCSKSSSSRRYTARQSEIIQAICSEIYKPYLDCKITLIHGPPGIGRTHIIIGILETLFYASKCNSNLKVLVTARSNMAVDEIGRRLIELNERYGLNNYTFKFVRVGAENRVHSKMLPYFIDRKAAELYKKHKERELQALCLQILNLEKEPNSLNKNEQLKSLNDQCKIIKDNISLKTGHYKTEIKYKCDILKETNIVLTTLSSCNLSILCKTFLPTPKSDLNFSCCIVDESTQCSEIEILQPLAFGISKLILIGDENQSPQLPAAHLEYANKYHFDRSMFNRFCQHFESSNQPSPVVYLTE